MENRKEESKIEEKEEVRVYEEYLYDVDSYGCKEICCE